MAIFYQPPEPRQAYPKVLPQTQGAQPKPAGPLGGSVNALTAIGVWATLAAVPMPVQKPLNVVPLTLRYGSQPAPQPALTTNEQVIARVWWPEANEPRLQFKNQQPERRFVAPQTLIYGSQPRPCGSLSVTQQNVGVRWWDLPQQPPPTLIGVAAIKGVPAIPVVQPFSPLPTGVWPQPTWLAQSAPLSAAWNVPAVVSSVVLRGNAPPSWVYGWWISPFIEIQYSGSFIPQSTVADQPAVEGPLAVVDITLLRSTWEPPRQEPPRPVAIATLTLARGDVAPFARPPIVWSALDWPYQSEENNAGWNFVPPVVSLPTPFTVQQHVVRYQWEPAFAYPESEANNAGWNIPAIVSQPTPYVRFRIHYVAPAIWWPSQHASPVAAFVNAVVAVTLQLAIAHSDGTDPLVSGASSSTTLVQNSGTISITPSDSKTIQLITGNSGVISLDSDG